MSAKFLHVFGDENPELQRQIGCMTGILQMFDRQHVLTTRHVNGYNHKRHNLSGNALTTSSSLRVEHGETSPKIVLEKTLSKSSNENQRMSMESSRTSFSSSSCSSFSSLDFSKSTQQEAAALPFERTIFPEKTSKNSSKSKTSNGDGRPPRCEPRDDLPNLSIQTTRRSLDFRDVVKDSINRDSRGLLVKTSSGDEEKSNSLKYRDSPRPTQISKSTDVKLKVAPSNFSEFGETPRSSFEATKAGSFHSELKGTHRFSFDGREIQRQSSEFPRLSLDSREGSLKNSNFDSKLNSILKDLDMSDSKKRITEVSKVEQEELVTHRRSTSIVVKLMGLEAMPSLTADSHDQIDSNKKDYDYFDEQRTRPLKTSQGSPQKFLKDSDSIIKPVYSSKVSVETAPWRHQKAKLTQREAQLKQQQDSVYSEIEKRLKELEFRQSSNDLRALKQILDAMQAKGLLENKNYEETAAENQKFSPAKSLKTRGTFESPIVIMKPAKSAKTSGESVASVIPIEGIPGIKKLRIHDKIGERKAFTKNRVTKGRTFDASVKELSDKKNSSTIKDNGAQSTRLRTVQISSKAQQLPRKDSGSAPKTSGPLSPRLQQKRLETERSRPPLPSSDSSKTQRLSASRKQVESVSPRNKLRKKPNQAQDNDEQSSESTQMKKSDCQIDEISLRSDNNIRLASHVDIEVNSADLSADMSSALSQPSSKSPSGRDARRAASIIKQKKESICLNGEVSTLKFVSTASEQPSPISVLDAAFYQDDLLSSPPDERLDHPRDEKNQISNDSGTPSSSLDSPTQSSSSEINHKKLQSIENLLQKLRELSPIDDGPSTTDHIASLCETKNPDHRYVSEILLASGLLLKDLSASPMRPMPIQLHASGHPINPDLFFVLEQTKSGSRSANGSKTDQDKLHRKLVFDVVNELIIQKLDLKSSAPHSEHFLRTRNLVSRFPSGQQLLKTLCSEIEKLQAETACSDDESNKSNEEVLRQTWGHFSEQVPSVVLEIERLIFKDLIDEIVSAEAVSASWPKSSRRRRRLFST